VLELRLSDAVRASLDGRLEGVGDRVEELPDRLLVYADDAEHALAEINRRQVPIDGTLIRRSSLEDVFLRLTGRELVD
jgi:lipooligosaccharide transport system ATP-binding protein